MFVPGNKEPLKKPKSVNWGLPLIIPLSKDVRYEEVAALNTSTSVCIELVKVFNEVTSECEPLVNPNAVICSEPLIVPPGNSLPVGMVTVFPLEIVNWSPLIESVCESVSDVK